MNRVPRHGQREDNEVNRDWEAAHKAFHMALISGCGSRILLANCEKLYDLNIRYRFKSRRKSRQTRTVSVEHDDLKDLALERRSDDADAALTSNFLKHGRFLLEKPAVGSVKGLS